MRRILLILTVITFTLAAPALVQDKRQSCVDVVHTPEDVIPVLGKRTLEEEMNMLWKYYNNVWRNRNPAVLHLQEPALPVPPNVPPPNPAEMHVPDVHVPPPNLAEMQVPDVHAPAQGPADSNHEPTKSNDDAPLASSESGHSHSTPPIPEGSTGSGDWRTAATAPSSSGPSTEPESDLNHLSAISNTPSAESQSENLNAADAELKGKAQISRRISESGTASHGGVQR